MYLTQKNIYKFIMLRFWIISWIEFVTEDFGSLISFNI